MLRKDLACEGQELRPLDRYGNFAGRAMEQFGTDFAFKLGQPCARDGRRKTEIATRSTDVQPFGSAHEQAEGRGIHRLYPNRENCSLQCRILCEASVEYMSP